MIILANIFEWIGKKCGIIQFISDPPIDNNIEISVNENSFMVSKVDFAKAIEQKKLNIKDENYLVFTKSDYETRQKNLEAGKYNEGKKTGSEMTTKEIRDYAKEKYGLEIDAHEDKDYKKLLEKITTKIAKDSSVPVDKKVQEHEKTIGSLRENLTSLQTENEKLKNEKEQIANDFQQKKYQLEVDNALNLLVPEKAVTETLTRKDIIALFRVNGYDAKMVDGKIVPVQDGEVVKHDITLEPEPLQKVLMDFVNNKKLIAVEGGRGAGDNIGSDNAGTWETFVREMTAKGITQGSEKFQNEQNLRIKNKTLKV